ncbi:hypothetical protein GBF35_16345 [Nonomuraea phyllanthi]|nr:hypothetical protein GBF35_16345 [Nonomuraea phyllanthi]
MLRRSARHPDPASPGPDPGVQIVPHRLARHLPAPTRRSRSRGGGSHSRAPDSEPDPGRAHRDRHSLRADQDSRLGCTHHLATGPAPHAQTADQGRDRLQDPRRRPHSRQDRTARGPAQDRDHRRPPAQQTAAQRRPAARPPRTTRTRPQRPRPVRHAYRSLTHAQPHTYLAATPATSRTAAQHRHLGARPSSVFGRRAASSAGQAAGVAVPCHPRPTPAHTAKSARARHGAVDPSAPALDPRSAARHAHPRAPAWPAPSAAGPAATARPEKQPHPEEGRPMNETDQLLIAQIPSDIDRPDKIAYGLTVRQILITATTGGVATAIYYLFHQLLPIVILAAVLLPLAALGMAIALGRRDGLSLDRFLLAALRFAHSPKRLVAAPDGVAEPPRWCRLRGKPPAPLQLPVRAIRTDGALDLADGGVAVLVETGTLSFHLRTAGEQAALAGAFGRWLNSLEAPVQILVRARPVDLGNLIDAVERRAASLPHPALADAAGQHAAFLDELNSSRELLAHQVLIVLRDNHAAGRRRRSVRREASAAVVLRRAAEAERSLAALGVTTRVLDAPAAHQVLTECLDPGGWHPADQALPDDIITGEETA